MSRDRRTQRKMPAKEHGKTSSRPMHSAHIKISGMGTGEAGDHYVKLRIATSSGRRYVLLPTDDLGSSDRAFFRTLNRQGGHLLTPASQRELVQRLQDHRIRPSFRVATKPGWCGSTFVLPCGVVGKSQKQIENAPADSDSDLATRFKLAGSYEGWAEIARLGVGNSRLMLALALGFVGPLGDVLGVEAPAIQLFGAPQSGKTGVGIAAGSIWGCSSDRNAAAKHGFGSTWNHTVNKIEDVAVAHNHTLLVLDETRLNILPGAVLDSAFRLDNGTEKGRLNSDVTPRSWWVPVLSTSNLTVDALAAAAKVVCDDAYRSRLIDVPAPEGGHGIFENLHGHADHAALTARLIHVATLNHGHAARKYVRGLVRWRRRDPDGLHAWLGRRRRSYLRRASGLAVHGRDPSRFHQRFATIYAAGRLAVRLGVLPWQRRDLLQAVLACEQAHFYLVAEHVDRSSPDDPARAVLVKLAERRARFLDTRGTLSGRTDPGQAYGFIVEYCNTVEYLLKNSEFQRLAGGKKLARAAKASLHNRALIASNWVKGELKFVVKRHVKGMSKRNYYVAMKEAAFAANALN